MTVLALQQKPEKHSYCGCQDWRRPAIRLPATGTGAKAKVTPGLGDWSSFLPNALETRTNLSSSDPVFMGHHRELSAPVLPPPLLDNVIRCGTSPPRTSGFPGPALVQPSSLRAAFPSDTLPRPCSLFLSTLGPKDGQTLFSLPFL